MDDVLRQSCHIFCSRKVTFGRHTRRVHKLGVAHANTFGFFIHHVNERAFITCNVLSHGFRGIIA
ncbi:Uncharacterised protein [Mycobacteroides abscessus subsp. abscessus]|nr:Uncharacterised protein [Mycobacteroides abscessus subsp. abscessus]